jgi:predicted membrane-bound mannosyltransferase/DNA-binding beta-propeller fold protein YncE
VGQHYEQDGGYVEQSLLDKPLSSLVRLDWEKALYLIVIMLALATRLWGLGDRVQSHDESIHTKYSWNLYAGHGFQHNPLMHGPFLFQATALSYFLFGDNDFTSRIPVALMGVAIVVFPYLLRRWLGRKGALATSFLLLVSPSIAYYSRYIRHDVPVILWALVGLFAIFSYLRDGRRRWLYLMAAGVSLMFATKEVAFIYNAIFGIFLVGLLVIQALERGWPNENLKKWFLVTLIVAVVALSLLLSLLGFRTLAEPEPDEQITPVWWILAARLLGGLAGIGLLAAVGFLLAGHLRREDLRLPRPVTALVIAVLGAGVLLRVGLPVLFSILSRTQPAFQEYVLSGRVHWVLTLLPIAGGVLAGLAWFAITVFRYRRVFDLIIVLGTLCLPFLSPGLISLADLNPIDYNAPTVYYSAAITANVIFLSAAIGLMWDLRRRANGSAGTFTWLIAAAVYYAIFLVLFTTVFTNGQGIGTGLVGSLGYWLAQQEVERGGQPWYYYIIMTGFYEYLPLLLSLIIAPLYLLVRGVLLPCLRRTVDRLGDLSAFKEYFVPFLLWWIVLTWAGYSVAGEKMPWLTVHVTLPMILLSGWLIGRLFKGIDWQQVLQRRAWLLALIGPPFVMALAMFIRAMFLRPFQGYDLAQLYATGQLVGGLVGTLAFGAGLGYLVRRSGWRLAVRVLLVVAIMVPVFVTIRTAWRFCYINYDYPTEFLVYAHAAPGVREAMEQIDELSRRIAGGLQLIEVAYGADGSTLFYWQLRDYPNAVHYGEEPKREDLDVPVIIAGRDQWGAVDPYAGDDYLVNTYAFLWWPMQDYFHLSWERVRNAITDPEMRAALWDIWYDRDYRKYDEVTGKTHTLNEWPLRSDFRLYIRRDVAAQIWDRSTSEAAAEIGPTDPYAKGWQDLSARLVFGGAGSATGQLQSPRGIKVGSDGYVYVADAGNYRIQKFTADGELVTSWDHSFDNPWFENPWDIAVAPDSTVYVADTWNHRVQKLDAEGNLVATWGYEQYAPEGGGEPGAFYGPRGIAVGPDGRVYLADTGNKRIQVFDPDGQFAFEWGGAGILEGQLDEPVGVAFGPDGELYVADTWNRRVQVFDADGNFLRQWPIAGWDTELPDEKPYIALDSQGWVYVTDPGHYRVLVFNRLGNYILSFGQYGFDDRSFALPAGIAIGNDDTIYVADAHGNRVLVFDALEWRP